MARPYDNNVTGDYTLRALGWPASNETSYGRHLMIPDLLFCSPRRALMRRMWTPLPGLMLDVTPEAYPTDSCLWVTSLLLPLCYGIGQGAWAYQKRNMGGFYTQRVGFSILLTNLTHSLTGHVGTCWWRALLVPYYCWGMVYWSTCINVDMRIISLDSSPCPFCW